MLLRLLITGVLLGSLTGCGGWLSSMVPDVYLVDRQTVMEADAAGEWPQLEQRLRQQLHNGPLPYAELDENLDQQPGFQILNAEYPLSSSQR